MKNLIIILSLIFSLYSFKENSVPFVVENLYEVEKSNFKTGDIIFQVSKSSQSKAIQLATNSKYSHIGLILNRENKLYVLEAVQPVKLTPLNIWIKRGEQKHYVVKRLKSSIDGFNKNEESKLIKEGKKHLNKNYDLAFEWSEEKMYCSELVWKIYKESLDIELSQLKKMNDFNLKNNLVKAKLKERYGDYIPLNEKVVSPSDIFESKLLETVYSK